MDIMRIVVTGPESTGKTLLAEKLSEEMNIQLVEEYARTYIGNLNRPYGKTDVEEIARIQIQENNLFIMAPLIYDTDILTSIIWHQEKFGFTPSWMMESWKITDQIFYLLCAPDFPWVYDDQRENPNDRVRLFGIYKSYLKSYFKDFVIIKGNFENRLSKAIINVKSILDES